MINRDKVVDVVKSGRDVTVLLRNATIVSVKSDIHRYGGQGSLRRKIIVKDPQLGSVWFSSFSDQFSSVERGDKLTMKVTVNGVGDSTRQYPDALLFAHTNTRSNNAVTILKHG